MSVSPVPPGPSPPLDRPTPVGNPGGCCRRGDRDGPKIGQGVPLRCSTLPDLCPDLEFGPVETGPQCRRETSGTVRPFALSSVPTPRPHPTRPTSSGPEVPRVGGRPEERVPFGRKGLRRSVSSGGYQTPRVGREPEKKGWGWGRSRSGVVSSTPLKSRLPPTRTPSEEGVSPGLPLGPGGRGTFLDVESSTLFVLPPTPVAVTGLRPLWSGNWTTKC